MTETQLFQTLKQGLPHRALTRVENLASGGEPDVTATRDGQLVRIELKVIKGYKLEAEPTQIAWAVRELSNRRYNSYILGRKEDTLLLWNIRAVPELVQYGILVSRGQRRPSDYSTAQRAKRFGQLLAFKTDKPWNWEGMENALFAPA